MAPRIAGSIEIQEFGFRGNIKEDLKIFVQLAIDSIAERASVCPYIEAER